MATEETVPVVNHFYRKVQRGKWKVVKVVGDSLAPEYEPDDLVLIEPARDSTVRTGDVAHVMLNGECLLKVLAFRRDRDTGRLLELQLPSLNPGYPELPVTDTTTGSTSSAWRRTGFSGGGILSRSGSLRGVCGETWGPAQP